MKPIHWTLVAGLAWLAPIVSLPAHAAVPAGIERLQALTDPFTVAVARLDVEHVDINAWAKAVVEFLPDPGPAIAAAVDQARQLAQHWRSALLEAGGRDVYAMFSLSDLGAPVPVAVVVPLGERGDATRISAWLKEAVPFGPMDSTTLSGCVVMAATPVLERLKTATGKAPRPLEAVFTAAPSGIVQVALAPYDDATRVIEDLMPTLPSVLGGGSSSAISRGLRWAALALAPPPDWTLEVFIQSRSATDAEALREAMRRGLTALGGVESVQRALPRWAEIQAALEPTAAGDTLRLRLEKQRLVELVRTVLLPALFDSRAKAGRIALMNNLKQVGLALIMYANDHEDKLPPHLADALRYVGSARVLLLPDSSLQPPSDLARQDRAAQVAWVDQNTCLVYVQPSVLTKDIKDPGTTILAHQKLETCREPFIGALFADGHAEIMARAAFDRSIEKNRRPPAR
jgi:hypothetical protein